MTESEWRACADPQPMAVVLGEIDTKRRQQLSAALKRELASEEYWDSATERRWRLVSVASCRRIWDAMTDRRLRRSVEIAERFADGRVGWTALRAASAAAAMAYEDSGYPSYTAECASHAAKYAASDAAKYAASDYAWDAVDVMWHAALAVARGGYAGRPYRPGAEVADGTERAAQAGLIREVFGNPFRPTTIPWGWLTSRVVRLGRGIYEARAFDGLPILADALEEAGCDDTDILDHCRSGGPHVRGCWAIDLVLGADRTS